MIIELNGLAGVGKHTVGLALADLMAGKLIDNHTIYNPAFAVTQIHSQDFYETVRRVRSIVFERASILASDIPIIFTVAPGKNEAWGREWQEAIRNLADERRSRLLGVHLFCEQSEEVRRIASPERRLLKKLTDASVLYDGVERTVLLDHCDAVLRLDTTDMAPPDVVHAVTHFVSGGR